MCSLALRASRKFLLLPNKIFTNFHHQLSSNKRLVLAGFDCKQRCMPDKVLNNYADDLSDKFSKRLYSTSSGKPLATKIQLNNGMQMPVLGLGTYMAKDGQAEAAVKHAIDIGYRHIDTAYSYQNEFQVGRAINTKISEGVISREDLFLVTKLSSIHHAKDKVEHGCRKSLENLGLDYIDLYLMHFPVGLDYVSDNTLLPKDRDEKLILSEDDYLDTYKCMEQLVKLGLVKAIGLSNFNSEQIDRILQNCTIKPVNNQIECHPALNQEKLRKFCEARDIIVTAYCPLGRPNEKTEKPDFLYSYTTAAIAKKYNKTPAQIILRYLVDIGVIPIPKSITAKRIEENFDVFDFNLAEEDIKTISGFDAGDRMVKFPLVDTNHKYYPFNIEY